MKPAHIGWSVLALLCGALIGFYMFCGIFVQQPIGAVPDGVTILYWRRGTNLPFVASADGILLEQTGEVSLLTRAVAIGKFGNVATDRMFARLPYSKTLYLISTDGVELSQ